MKISIFSCVFVFGFLLGCVSGGYDSTDTERADRPVATTEVEPGAQIVTAAGPVEHQEECVPVAETKRAGPPSVEFGLTTPVGELTDYSSASFYSRYVCH